jgi:hypothetical protein
MSLTLSDLAALQSWICLQAPLIRRPHLPHRVGQSMGLTAVLRARARALAPNGTGRSVKSQEAVWLWPKMRVVVGEQREDAATCPVRRTVLVGVESAPALACCTARRSRPKRWCCRQKKQYSHSKRYRLAVLLSGRVSGACGGA